MKKRNLVYIGNHLRSSDKNPTYSLRLIDRLEQEGYKVWASSSKNNKFLRFLDMWATLLKRSKQADYVLIDTYSTLNFYYAIIIGWWARRLGLSYIPVMHGGNLPKRLQNNPKTVARYCQGAKLVVCPSTYLAEQFRAAGIENVKVIPNAIDISVYSSSAANRNSARMVWLRAFSPLYNPQMAIKAFAELVKEFPEAELIMAGPGDNATRNSCKRLAEELGVNVTFYDRIDQEQWRAIGTQAGIFLNTSTADNQPLSVLEAQAMGLAVVSTEVGGMPYMITEGEDGLLVPSNDGQAMAAAIKKILASDALGQRLRNNAIAKAATHDWPIIVAAWKSVLN